MIIEITSPQNRAQIHQVILILFRANSHPQLHDNPRTYNRRSIQKQTTGTLRSSSATTPAKPTRTLALCLVLFCSKNQRRGSAQRNPRVGMARRAVRKDVIPKAACFWILVEGHSASRLCAAVCSFGSDGQGARKQTSLHTTETAMPPFSAAKSNFKGTKV